MAKQPSIAELLEKIDRLTRRMDGLERENSDLRERLAKYETPKNSRNSSVPPSKDENRPKRTKSLREKSDRKVGGQPGRLGNTLRMSQHPDKIASHIPDYCGCCGNDLEGIPAEFVGKRQVLDIPPIVPQYTEHRVYQRTCTCGNIAKSSFPTGVNAPVSYGGNVESLIGYFHCRQYLPFDRMKEVFRDVLGLSISEGGLHHVLKRLSAKALPTYELIRERIANSKVVGTDETGMKINGKNNWYWTWQNNRFTFIAASRNRGYQTIEDNFGEKLNQAILVHDCWKSHFKTGAGHQLCLPHLLRELNYFTEKYKDPWAASFKKMLNQAIMVKKKMTPEKYLQPYGPRSEIEKSIDALLLQHIDEKHKELVSFKNRMLKYREHLLTFMYHHDVPHHNNASEGALRNVKVKQKISGQFKSMPGAKQFAVLRSITDTAIKNGGNVLNALYSISQLNPTD